MRPSLSELIGYVTIAYRCDAMPGLPFSSLCCAQLPLMDNLCWWAVSCSSKAASYPLLACWYLPIYHFGPELAPANLCFDLLR